MYKKIVIPFPTTLRIFTFPKKKKLNASKKTRKQFHRATISYSLELSNTTKKRLKKMLMLLFHIDLDFQNKFIGPDFNFNNTSKLTLEEGEYCQGTEIKKHLEYYPGERDVHGAAERMRDNPYCITRIDSFYDLPQVQDSLDGDLYLYNPTWEIGCENTEKYYTAFFDIYSYDFPELEKSIVEGNKDTLCPTHAYGHPIPVLLQFHAFTCERLFPSERFGIGIPKAELDNPFPWSLQVIRVRKALCVKWKIQREYYREGTEKNPEPLSPDGIKWKQKDNEARRNAGKRSGIRMGNVYNKIKKSN